MLLSVSGGIIVIFALLFLAIFIGVVVVRATLTAFSIHTKHVKIFVETKEELKSFGKEKIVEVFNDLLDLIHLVPAVILLLAVALTFLGLFSGLEDVEERVGINSLDNCSGLASLLMLLLLLDLLLGWVFSFQPLDVCSSNALQTVLSLVLKNNFKGIRLEEVILSIESHRQGELHVLGLRIFS